MYMPRKYQLKHNFPIANTSNGIRINLCHDMDKILAQKLENMGIKRKSPTDASMDYFRLQRRLVTTQPRRIVKSKEFTCPKAYAKKLLFIENWIKQGKNLSPFMSRTITDLKKEDMMLYDWGIFHLHLSDEFDLEKRDGFMKRSAYLLMVRITEDTVYFIQVIPHNQKNVWTNSDYIRILRDN